MLWALGSPSAPELAERWLTSACEPIDPDRTRVTVLVANLLNDSEEIQKGRLARAINDYSALRAVSLNRVLRLANDADVDSELQRLHEEGREYIRRCNADVLVWGETDESGFILYVTTPASETRTAFYPANRVPIELPVQFDEALFGQLIAHIGAAADLENEGGRFLVREMERLQPRIQALLESGDRILNDVQRSRLHYAAGRAAQTIGVQANDPEHIGQAVEEYSLALDFTAPDARPEDFALYRYARGLAYLLGGAMRDETQAIESAFADFAAAQTIWTRDSHPVNWANLQNGISSAHWRMGVITGDVDRLRRAEVVLRPVLEIISREENRWFWLSVRNNQGTILNQIGARTGDTALMREAVAVHRDTLVGLDRNNHPVSWATFARNLAVALSTLGSAQQDTEPGRESLRLLESVMEIWTVERSPLNWARTKVEFASSMWDLGRIANDIQTQEAAFRHYRAAFEVLTPDFGGQAWVNKATEFAQRLSITVPPQREDWIDRLREIVAIYEQLRSYHRANDNGSAFARASMEMGFVQMNLSAVYHIERHDDAALATLRDAIETHRQAARAFRAIGDERGAEEADFRVWAGRNQMEALQRDTSRQEQ